MAAARLRPARRIAATALLTAGLVATLVGCRTEGAPAREPALTIANALGTTWTCGFNPFGPEVGATAFGLVYEPLVYVNVLEGAEQTPMLASAARWSDGFRTLTFTIRPGVRWSDGESFTAADVAFTFDLLKRFPALDTNALWSSGLRSAEQQGSDRVVLRFSGPAEPYFTYAAGLTPMLPRHIWSEIADPVTFVDAEPVGTGPYTVGRCSPQNIRYTANRTYWQSGKPAVQAVDMPSYSDNGPANKDLASGEADWGAQYIPSIDRYYLAKDRRHFRTWSPPTANVSLALNLVDGATADVRVRRAIAYAVDRAEVARVGVGGQQPAANQTGVVRPTFDDWYDADAAAEYDYRQDVQKAKALLADAGYSVSRPLRLTVLTVSGFSDWDASLQEIRQQLAAVGVELTVQDLAYGTYGARLSEGRFQAAYFAGNGGPTPYYELRQLLSSDSTAPIGSPASSNFGRFSDPEVDRLLADYAEASSTEQHRIIDRLQAVMLREVPVVPITEAVNWSQTSTRDFTGWPTEADPYALPSPAQAPDIGQVLLRLTPAG